MSKKIVIIGNCQARPLAKLLKKLNPRVDVTAIIIVHLTKSEQFAEYEDQLEEADLIVSQLVADQYPCDFVRTSFLKERYGKKVVSVLNLFFRGYNPDWFYIRIPGKGPLRGPMGDYHNRTIFESWEKGETADVAAQKLESQIHNEPYKQEIAASLSELKRRESLVDVPVVDFVRKKYRKARLFFTFNHPSMALMREYAKRILKAGGLGYKRSIFPVWDWELLDQFIPLVNPAVDLPKGEGNRHRGVQYDIDRTEVNVTIGKRREYSSEEIANAFYEIYSALHEDLELQKLVSG